jgi:hypothetical protein
MAVTIDWDTFVINVPKADTTLIQASPEIRELDVDWFRLQLKDIEDNVDGQPFTDTHIHNTEVTLAGLTLARVVEIIDPYTITFEDGQYAVNLVGANNNIADKTNVNQVSIRSSNSAGLTSLRSVWDEIIAEHLAVGTTGKALSDAGGAGNPWGAPVSGNTDAGTFGELVGKKLLTIGKFLGLK